MRIEDYHEYKIEDFEISKTDERYGPVWVLTPLVGPLVASSDTWQKSYVLRSDVLMDKSSWSGSKEKPSVHVDVVTGAEPLKQSHGWKGAFRTSDMDKAAQWLIAELNENQKLEIIGRAMEDAKMELEENLSLLDNATQDFPKQDLDEIIARVRVSYDGMMSSYEMIKAKLEVL